jgi:hypothetical protein
MPGVFKYSGDRKSHQSLNEVYFWTSGIKDWKHLLIMLPKPQIAVHPYLPKNVHCYLPTGRYAAKEKRHWRICADDAFSNSNA